MTSKPSGVRVLGLCAALTLLASHGPYEGLAAPRKPVLNAADLAYLWPPPANPTDVNALISGDLTLADGATRLWPQAVFDALMKAVEVPEFDSGRPERPFRIVFGDFKPAFEKPATWKLTGFRFDPSAPGGHKDVVTQFGSTPQLRFVFQPVTTEGFVRVHDVTAHLAFSFTVPGAKPIPAQPDKAAVKAILDELRDLKRASESGGASTDGPLGIHPGLAANPAGFRDKVRTFVQRAAARGQLTELAFMGVQRPEPWIFFLMRRGADGSFSIANVTALGKKNAQMLSMRTTPQIEPEPTPRNVPPQGGVSTARLFNGNGPVKLDERVFPGQARPLVRDIPDIIANPERSNVTNTDCLSCHTESTRRRELEAESTDARFRYRVPAGISRVDPAMLPTSDWNVRNFGWFEFRGVVHPTITQRTANEAAEAADFANRVYFAPSSNGSNGSGSGLASGAEAAVAATSGSRSTARSAMTEQRKPVASPLTLVMRLKSPQDYKELKAKIEKLQSLPPDKNPIMVALNDLGTVHFARFVFLGETHLAVITTYDGAFEDYIDSFVETIGDIFDVILAHVAEAPPLPVRKPENRKAFLDYVRKNDLTAMPPFYSAYPDLSVAEILRLQRKQ